jgi:hypothetical protein
MVFYQVFLLSPSQCTVLTVETVRGCVILKKEKSQGKAAEVPVNSKEKTLKTFVWISSKNSASGRGASALLRVHNALDIWAAD